MLALHRAEINLDRLALGLVLRHHHPTPAGGCTLQLPAQRACDPARDERSRDSVAPAFTRVVDPYLGDAGQERPAIHGPEELGDGLSPRPQSRPLQVGQTETMMRDLQQVR